MHGATGLQSTVRPSWTPSGSSNGVLNMQGAMRGIAANGVVACVRAEHSASAVGVGVSRSLLSAPQSAASAVMITGMWRLDGREDPCAGVQRA